MAFLGNFRNASVTINAVDLSNHVKTVTVPRSWAELDTTCMGDTARRRLTGLADGNVDLEFVQEFGGTSVDATLSALLGAAPFAVKIRPDSGAISTTNPELQFNAIISSYEPMSGTVGDLLMAKVALLIDGAVTIDTTP